VSRNKDPRKMCGFHRLTLARRCPNCAEKGPHRLPVGGLVGPDAYTCVELPQPPACPNCKARTPLPSLDGRPVARRRRRKRR